MKRKRFDLVVCSCYLNASDTYLINIQVNVSIKPNSVSADKELGMGSRPKKLKKLNKKKKIRNQKN